MMESQKGLNETIEMLAKNEEAVARLYKAYSEKFIKHKDFWFGLAEEEVAHACCIRTICAQTDKCDYARFKPELLEMSLKYLDDKVRQVRTEDISFVDALSIALDLETNMIESNYFEVFDTDSNELRNSLDELRTATQAHANKIRDSLAKKRK